jgi:galactokinase
VSDDAVRGLFASVFGGDPEVVTSAPARVNLIGEHTDYNGGEVLPIAIARRSWVAARAVPRERSRAVSSTEPAGGEFDARRPERAGQWWDYLAGVAAALRTRGIEAPAAELAVWSDVPAGAGLSSSAALEVATGLALVQLAGGGLGPRDLALAAQSAEVGFVGVNCGIMDQFASSLAREAHALHLWCETGEIEHVPMTEAVLIFDTALPHDLRSSDYNTRRAECERALAHLRRHDPALRTLAAATPELVRSARLPEPLDRRSLHVVEETHRVREAVEALRRDGRVPGALLLASHASLRDLYECSTPQLDWFVEHVSGRPGVDGARLTGAGWGGCAIALGEEGALRAAAEALAPEFERAFGWPPRHWLTHACAGARVEGH